MEIPFSLVYILVVLIYPIRSAFPPSLRYPLKVSSNKISDVKSVCDSQNVNITISLKRPFKGVAFAKDFAQECKVFGKYG